MPISDVRPLSGVVVLEIGNSLSEQLTGKHLQMLGAQVYTLSPPMSDYSYILTKDKIVIHDLTEAPEKIDVVISRHNKEINPDIIYLSMPNFSSTDEEYANVQDYEANILALSGVYIDNGIDRKLMGVAASYTQLPLASTYGSVHGALAVVVALNKGRGDVIEVPLASALMDTLVYNSIEYHCSDFYRSARARSFETNLDYYDTQELKDPFYCHYICSDGRPFYLVCPGHINHQTRTFEILDIEEEVKILNIPTPDCYNDPGHGLGAGQIGDRWIKPLKKLMNKVFLTKTSFDWEVLFGEHGIPSTSHRTTKEWVESEHAISSGLIYHEDGMVYPGPISWVQTDDTHNPNYTTVPDNMKILDLSNVIAGPTIGSMLARFGAEVIKVDAPNPVYSPDITILYGMVANTDKKSVLLDVVKGRNVIKQLIKKSDIVIINSTDKGLERLGLTQDDLKKINPNIILVHFDAWGGPSHGTRSNYLGYDDNVQAGLGIMERYGGGMGRVEEHAHIGTIDVIAGVAGALAAMSAVYYKNKNNSGVLTARSSLASLGQLIQFPFVCSNPEDTLRSGPLCKGEHDLFSMYETKDEKWVMLLGKSMEDLTQIDSRFKHHKIKDVFLEEPAEHWKDLLNIEILRSIKEVREKYRDHGDTYQFNTYEEHPIGNPITMFSPCSVRSKNTIIEKQKAAVKYGEHTIEVLESMNIECSSLMSMGIISDKWSNSYLPLPMYNFT